MLGSRRLIARPHRLTQLSADRHLAVSGAGCHLLSSVERHVLESWRRSAEPKAQARIAAARFCVPEGRVAAAISELLALGLLVCADGVISAGLPDRAESRESLLLVVITRDRPEALRACLRSFLDNARAFQSPIAGVAVYDASEPETERANASVLRDLAVRSPQIRYCGAGQRAEYARALARAGARPDQVRLAVEPHPGVPSYGAARNLVLLDTVGELVLCTDDDMLARTAVHPQRRAGQAVVGHQPPYDISLFASRSEALAAACWEPRDVFAEHLSLLGRPPGGSHLGETDFSGVCPHFFDLREEPRIVATLPGKVGASGRPGRLWADFVLAHRGHPVEAPGNAPEVIEVSPLTALAHGFGCMAGVIGLDNRVALPPFPSRFRAEDGVFAAVLGRARPAAFWGVPDHAVVHNRADSDFGSERPFAIGHSDLASAVLREWPRIGPSRDPAAAVCAIGAWFAEHGRLSAGDLRRATLGRLAEDRSGTIREMEHLSRADPCPPRRERWRALVGDAIGEIARLGAEASTELEWASFGSYLRDYGEVLAAWADLRLAASQLRARGVRASRALDEIP